MAPPTASASALTDRGREHYRAGHFEAALAEFKSAYEMTLNPDQFIDIARCHRRLGHSEAALFFFQGYLESRPEGAARAGVEREVAEVEADAAAHREAAAVPVYRRAAFWAGLTGGVLLVGGGAVALGLLLRRSPLPSDTLGTFDAR